MDEKADTKDSNFSNKHGKTNTRYNTGFDISTLPFFGPSAICIIIIGGPRGFYRFVKNVGRHVNTRMLIKPALNKLNSGLSLRTPLFIPVAYGGIEGLLSGFRGVDDEFNVIAAGTLTGMLYKAFSGVHQIDGLGGLTGLLLSSLCCLLMPYNVSKTKEDKKDYGDSEELHDDY